ncbi:MAG: hypothetical protein ACI4JZ_00295 [Oscillospiraceae bacterium]
MFTNISKVILWIGIAAGFIASIILGTRIPGWEFLVMLGGWIATLIIFSLYGMIVEMASNINKSRKLLETMSNTQPALPARQTKEEVNENIEGVYEDFEEVYEDSEDDDDMWKCEKCKCFNEVSSTFCIYCGTPKS